MTGSIATGNGLHLPGQPVQGADEPPAWDMEINPEINWSNGQTYKVLHLREPTAKELRDAQEALPPATVGTSPQQGTDFQIVLVSKVTGAPRGVVEKLRFSELQKAFDFLAALMAGGQPTIPT